jgi:DNA-binding transcriptional LysR family regulator
MFRTEGTFRYVPYPFDCRRGHRTGSAGASAVPRSLCWRRADEHPLCGVPVTPERYAAARHILISHRGLDRWPIDDSLEPLDLKREIATVGGGYSESLALVRGSDLIASVPKRYYKSVTHAGQPRPRRVR